MPGPAPTSVTPTPSPTPTPVASPDPTPTPTPVIELPDETAPSDGVAYIAARASELANAIVDAFWKMVALFTADGSGVPWASGLTDFNQPVTTVDGAAAVPVDVLRLARQASFGPTPQLVSRISELGIPGWIDEQFRVRGSTYVDLATFVPRDLCDQSPDPKCRQNNFSRAPVAVRFYANAVIAPDQLRQRVAFALSQILVVSTNGATGTGPLASYEQVLLDNAFGNYRDVLGKVALHGFMGKFLSMADSSRLSPSENFARELLQLFTCGPIQLNSDGTPVLDGAGHTVLAYSQDDVRGIARALTGWTYSKSGGRTDWTGSDLSLPMTPRPGHYDSAAKSFLGTTVPAGASQIDSVNAVLDAAFNHPSTPPFVAKRLIQHLVTSNPSPAYVGRIAAVFVDNGKGVRGDLKAVIRAILLDPAARLYPNGSPAPGKVKEPILAMTALVRAIGTQTDGQSLFLKDTALGQPVFQAPSVFNFYSNNYPLAGSATLVSPASQLYTAGGATALQNLMRDWTLQSDPKRGDFNFDSGLPNFTGTVPLWGGWEAIATDTDRLVAVVNLLMLDNSATETQKQALRNAALSITHRDPQIQARRRAQALLYIAATSPNFLVDR